MKYDVHEFGLPYLVSTLVVEWIEIDVSADYVSGYSVSTLVVEWIEIFLGP